MFASILRAAFAAALICALPSVSLAASDHDTCYSLNSESNNYKDPANYDRAIAACTRLINAYPYKDKKLAALYRVRAFWKTKKPDLDSALADHAIAIGMEPGNVESHDYRADIYLLKGDFDRALEEYNHATRIDATYAAAYYSRGKIYEHKGNFTQARIEYNAALAVPTINRLAGWAQGTARARLKLLDEQKK